MDENGIVSKKAQLAAQIANRNLTLINPTRNPVAKHNRSQFREKLEIIVTGSSSRRGKMGGGRGGRNRARTQRKHFVQSRENVWKLPKSDDNSESNGNKSGWEPFATQNPAFVDYYKEQGTVAVEEWDTFMECLHKPLPAAFRVNSSGPFCEDIRLQLENDFMKSLEFEVTDEGENNAIRPLPWYPENLAWHSNYSRMQLRKNKTLERFHEFLKLENEIGNITRQEAVSMVPPLFLDVCPDHFVLDMCAAPGSKTFQLLEIIHKSSTSGPGLLPSGMVIANDVDVQRSNLLIHQTKRMCTANLIVTNHEAQHFPGCRLSRCLPSPTETEIVEDSSLNQLIFDRVLCDVPCSGDGTLRKAPDIWRKWNSGIGSGFHGLQLKIALRGLALLKVGGRMVYSTCSMNPIENEAVVAEILRRCAGSVELVDVSHELPELVRRPGVKKWKVCDKGTWSASYKDVPRSRRGGIVPSMFPSGRSYSDSNADDTNMDGKSEIGENGHSMEIDRKTEDNVAPADALDEVSELPLERCIRIVPHDQNSGAFFIAVLHKVSSLPATAIQEKSNSRHGNSVSKKAETCEKPIDTVVEETKSDVLAKADGTSEKTTVSSPIDGVPDSNLSESVEDHDTSVAPEDNEQKEAESLDNTEVVSVKPGDKRKLQIQGRWKGVDPVLFFNDETIISKIHTFYGISESFPLKGHLISRNSDNNHVKRLYYVSESVKDVLQLNLLAGQQLKIASVGLKMFERQTSKEGSASPCAFRISSEGLPLILPYITKQILYGSLVDFKHLLQYKSIKFADFVDAEFGEKASKLMMGCCVVVLRTDNNPLLDSNKPDASTIAIGCWRGRGSLTVMVTAIECQEMLERLAIRLGPEKKEPADEVVQPGLVDGTEVDTADVEKNEDEDTNCGDLI